LSARSPGKEKEKDTSSDDSDDDAWRSTPKPKSTPSKLPTPDG
jgi:hypothetical protein